MHFQGDASLGLAGEGRFSATVLLFCPCHLTSTCSHRGLGDHTIGGGVQGKPHKWLVGRVRPTPTSPHWWGHWTTPPLPHQLSCAAWGVSPPPPASPLGGGLATGGDWWRITRPATLWWGSARCLRAIHRSLLCEPLNLLCF